MSIPTIVVVIITCLFVFVTGYLCGRFASKKVEGTLYITDTPEMTSYHLNVDSFDKLLLSDYVIFRVERHNKGV